MGKNKQVRRQSIICRGTGPNPPQRVLEKISIRYKKKGGARGKKTGRWKHLILSGGYQGQKGGGEAILGIWGERDLSEKGGGCRLRCKKKSAFQEEG